ncbi:MAG: hypothetical protein H0W99_13560 [Acidobacteria bacterium]|nr:hypothetical protein [Acidobacteriota bacterium]
MPNNTLRVRSLLQLKRRTLFIMGEAGRSLPCPRAQPNRPRNKSGAASCLAAPPHPRLLVPFARAL